MVFEREGRGFVSESELGWVRQWFLNGFLGLEPGDGFCDALLEGGFWLSKEGVGFFHGDDVVGDHAAEAGGGDVEGFSGDGGNEVAG